MLSPAIALQAQLRHRMSSFKPISQIPGPELPLIADAGTGFGGPCGTASPAAYGSNGKVRASPRTKARSGSARIGCVAAPANLDRAKRAITERRSEPGPRSLSGSGCAARCIEARRIAPLFQCPSWCRSRQAVCMASEYCDIWLAPTFRRR